MEKKEILTIAGQIASNCATCGEVAKRFNTLVKEYGKEDAKLIQAQAKELVKQSKESMKLQAGATVLYLSSASVAKVAFRHFMDSDSNGEFAKIVVDMRCGGSIDEFITKYAPYYTNVNGAVVVLNKYAKLDEDGERIAGEFIYKPKRIDTAIGCLSALKASTKGAKRCALGAGLSDVSRFIPADEVEWPAEK